MVFCDSKIKSINMVKKPRASGKANKVDKKTIFRLWPADQVAKILKYEEIIEVKMNKTKRSRTLFTTDQLSQLEKEYSRNQFITVPDRKELARRINIGEKQIKTWFQNRRMKEKRQTSETEYDSISVSEVSVATQADNKLAPLSPSHEIIESIIAHEDEQWFQPNYSHYTPNDYFFSETHSQLPSSGLPESNVEYNLKESASSFFYDTYLYNENSNLCNTYINYNHYAPTAYGQPYYGQCYHSNTSYQNSEVSSW